MKRVILATLITTTLTLADFIGGEVDLGFYSHSPSGTAQNGDDIVDIKDDLKWQDENDIFIRAYFEHPIPIIPNIRVGYTKFGHSGEGSVTKSFFWGLLNIDGDVNSDLDLDIYDLTLYYEFLDNWINLDGGLNLKYLNGTIDVNSDHRDISVPIPMLYAKGKIDIPATDLSVLFEGDYVTYDNNQLYDVEVGARYNFALGFGIEAGYKALKIKVNDVDNVSMDTKFNGAYGKLVWDF